MPTGSRRKRIDDGTHPFDDPTYDLKRGLFFGKPRKLRPRDTHALYETETDYLRRHSLLSDAELTALNERNR